MTGKILPTNPRRPNWSQSHGICSQSVVGTCRTSTERQIKKSLMIDKEDPRNLINNKSEWGQNLVPRQATEFRHRVWEDRDQRQII